MKALNPQARLILKQLNDEHDIQLDPVRDFADLAELHRLGEEMLHPGAVENTLALLDLPVHLDGLAFYRLTFGATFWLEQVGRFWHADDVAHFASVIFAMAHCRKPDVFSRLTDPMKARKKVLRWANTLKCSVSALERLCEVMLPQQEQHDDAPGGYGPVVSMLLCEIGMSPTYWVWECPAELQVDIIDGISAIKFEDKRVDKKQFNPFDPYNKACREWHNFKNGLIERHTLHGKS